MQYNTILLVFIAVVLTAYLSYFTYYTTTTEKNKIYKVDQIPIVGERDAFGRERVAMPFTLADYDHVFGNNIDFHDKTTGSGNITPILNEAAIQLIVQGNIAGTAIHQSKRYHHYMPGKSQSILASFVLNPALAGTTKRLGYFDDDNGIFFEQDGQGNLSFNIRTYVSGAPNISEKVNQNEWNGTKYNLDVTKTQLLFIDFQWLGVGKVRCGFVEGNDYILCHTFYHANVTDKVFMSNPNLPIRCEISSDGSGENIESVLNQICSTVISEGGYSESGRDWSWGTSVGITVPPSQEKAILAIRLSDNFDGYSNRMTVRLGNISLLSDGNNIFYRVLRVLNADNDFSGVTWEPVNSDSGVCYGVSPILSGTDYYQIESGYTAGDTDKKNSIASVGAAPPLSAKQNYITLNYEGNNSESYVIMAKNIGTTNDADVFAAMQWREIY